MEHVRPMPAGKKVFNYRMSKYEEHKDEQLQYFPKAKPKGSWKGIEFASKRELMDEFLFEINSHKPVKGNPKSLPCYARTISVFVKDLEDNGYQV